MLSSKLMERKNYFLIYFFCTCVNFVPGKYMLRDFETKNVPSLSSFQCLKLKILYKINKIKYHIVDFIIAYHFSSPIIISLIKHCLLKAISTLS